MFLFIILLAFASYVKFCEFDFIESFQPYINESYKFFVMIS